MNTCLHQLMNTVEAAGLDTPDDFSRDAFALHALALSKLPAEARERALQEIECGRLRQAVSLFDRPTYPKANGKGGAH
jgi:hypothetical protein